MKKIYDIQERSYRFSLNIIKLLDALPKDYIAQTMGRQLLRSSTSVGANIVEAQAASSKKDFINFYRHSLKLSNETRYWLRLFKDSKKLKQNQLNVYLNEVDEISKILGASIKKLLGKS